MVCQPPCSWMDVKLGWPDRSDYTRRDASYLRMYFTTRVKAKNTAEDYPISSLVSDIGGYVGLMVGRTKIDTGTRNRNTPSASFWCLPKLADSKKFNMIVNPTLPVDVQSDAISSR